MVSVLLKYIIIFGQTVPIMLALYLMLLATYYAQNYAGIIGWSLLKARALKQVRVCEIVYYRVLDS